jgi:hypothetical protein
MPGVDMPGFDMVPPASAEPGPLPPEPVDEPRPGPGLDMVLPPGAPRPELLPTAAPPPVTLLGLEGVSRVVSVPPDCRVVLPSPPVVPGLIAPEPVEPVPAPVVLDPVPWACRSTAVPENVNAATVAASPFRIELRRRCIAPIFTPCSGS